MDAKIKNLHDYVFGVEVGLDTNARKNRGGINFSQTVSEYLRVKISVFKSFEPSKKSSV